ncbi:MAG TPA: hypothetical protein VEY67_06245, partial [Candidatus Dormibacteraeota bacterium]|nr:hypothetical protein [Candidatus Dormibacteraeota bacterium]
MTDRPLEPALPPERLGDVANRPGAASDATARVATGSHAAAGGGGSGGDAEGVSLTARLKQPRTIVSILIPIVMLVLIFRVALNVDVGELVGAIGRSNKLFLLVAFVVFYLGFPLRGLRWVYLLRGAGFRLSWIDG